MLLFLTRFAFSTPLSALLLFGVSYSPILQASSKLSAEQQAYLDAYEAIKRNDREAIAGYKQKLQNYVLYPYVLYHDYRVNLEQTPPQLLEHFLKQHADFYLADTLRTQWLSHLAATQQWQRFLTHYQPQKSQSLQCHFFHITLEKGNAAEKQNALKQAQQLWQNNASLPKACDPLEKQLREQNHLTTAMIWQRIEQLLKKKEYASALTVGKGLSEKDQASLKTWIAIIKNPSLVAEPITAMPSALRKKAFLQGVTQLAAQDSILAKKAIERFAKSYGLSLEQQQQVERRIALRSAYRYAEDAKNLLQNLNQNGGATEETLRWQAQIALRGSKWRDLLDTIELMPAAEQQQKQWRYWQARALEKLGDKTQAKTLYRDLAKSRSYYGFLAADRIDEDYRFNLKKAPTFDRQQLIQKYPALHRIQELIAVDWLKTAQVEWHHFLPTAKTEELTLIAALANQWQQYPHAIRGLALAKEWDHIERFPTPHKQPVMQNAQKNQIDAAWIYGIIRRESAFNADIRSSVGAVGLMQIMPKTATYIGKISGNRNTSVQALTEAENNIELGSAYMRYLADKYQGHKVLATAAYNAGPHRVKVWTANLQHPLEADQWVDSIPFTETRDYVKAVMEYTTVFNSLLHGKYNRLRDTMPPIGNTTLAQNDE
ncbi:MAG: transglycosylase SLT domain-containing protein [Thiotrichales bacterium]|nr:transglycosylase SLT domain-containing protein [Thiotrichales bacterium]